MTANKIIATLREISDIITQSDGDAESVAEQIGTIREKIFSQYEVTPKFEGIESASVVPQPMGDETGHVNLKLSEGIPLDDLKSTFGAYNQPPAMPNVPTQGLFELNTSSTTHRVTLIAPLDAPATTTITLRRDIKL